MVFDLYIFVLEETGERKSERIAVRTSFSKFTNGQETPIILDKELEVQMHNPVNLLLYYTDNDVSLPPTKKLKIKKADGKSTPQTSSPKKAYFVNDEDNEVSLSPRKKLKLKIKKAEEKRTPQTSYPKKTDFVNAEEKDDENDDDDFVKATTSKSYINVEACFNQKRTINDMGFKPVLNLKLDSIPIELAFWMVQNYNADTSTLNVGTCLIRITPKVVHKVMGIPLGTIPIEEKRSSGKDPVVTEWRSFYRNTTILDDNLDSNTKQLMVVDQDDGYDAEEEEYSAICNEYKENEEHDFMISDSGNHLILPATGNDHVAEEFAPETVNLQLVIVKDKTNVLKGNEEFEIHNEEKRTELLSSALAEYEECFKRVHTLISKAVQEYPNSNMLGQKEKEWTGLVKKTYDYCVTYMKVTWIVKKEKKMIDGVEENTMETDEVVEWELKIQQLEGELTNEELETNSNEKAKENHIEDWEFLYKTTRFCITRKDGSILYLDYIKEVLNLTLQDIKRMIQLKEDGISNSNKENYLIRCMKNFLFGEENMQPKYDQTPYNEEGGECESGGKNKESADEARTSDKNTS
ncbi:hypothetical protein L1987_21472 [Smallanthus sonchifolius]|uniref:Uncharacterized protein n=1 Tax=Smallanthus sonchifolius TaxID=185202 RepID=A0ACB9IW54_9ASTR|nr:hypothetical protein L1987_21472 [Smallanthus sonchifolius]